MMRPTPALLTLLIPTPGWSQPLDEPRSSERDTLEQVEKLKVFSLEDLLDLDVSVTSAREEPITRSPGIVTTLAMEDMRAAGVRTLKDALEHVPNVILAEAPVGTTSVSIRGLSETFNQKVLFLLEGVPYWNSSHGDIPLLGMPMEAIDRIEVIRGPGAVVYGTNASAGVINVVLKKDRDEGIMALTSGSQGLVRFDTNYVRPSEDGFAYVAASLQATGFGYDAEYPETVLVPPFSLGTNADGDAFPTRGTVEKNEEYANAAAGVRRGNFNAMVHLFQSVQNGLGGAPVIVQRNDLIYRGGLVHADYTLELGELDLKAYADHNIFYLQLDIDNFIATLDSTTATVTAAPGRQRYRGPLLHNFRNRAGVTATYPLLEALEVMLGAENEVRSAGRYDKTDWSDNQLAKQSDRTRVNEVAGYAQLDWQLGELRAVAGARLTHNSLAGTHLAPRASLVYSFNDESSVKLLYSEGFNSPVISQQDLLIPFVIEGNRDLEAEVLCAVELAYTYATSRLLLVANGYLLSTHDVIARTQPDGALQPIYTNVDGFSRWGGEIDAQLSVDRLRVLANVSYNHGGNEEDEDDALRQFVPEVHASVAARYTVLEHHTFGLSTRFLSERAQADAQILTRLAYTFAWRSVSAQAVLTNLWDRDVVDPDINSNRIPLVPGGPGRSLYVTFKYVF